MIQLIGRDVRKAISETGKSKQLVYGDLSWEIALVDWLCELRALKVEHLRGFDTASLPLGRERTLLVGPNNSGKTSLLRLLDWVINGVDEDLLGGYRLLTEEELALLLPARDTRGGARRLSLSVHIPDGRRGRTYQAVDGVATLRIQLRDRKVVARLGSPRRGESESDGRAITLLSAVQANHPVLLIAPSRDAYSPVFTKSLKDAIRARLGDRLLHHERGGAPAEYRKASKALRDIEELAERQAGGLIEDIQSGMSGSMTQKSSVDFRATPQALVEWLADRANLAISTGSHDDRMVPPEELGSGLQSLLSMQILNANSTHAANSFVLLEEPEAFLHPSAQRTLARSLFDAQQSRMIISTHSTVVVDEAAAADICLVQKHRVYAPRTADSKRQAISTALLTGQGSEAIFARSVLLVEGPGDRAFFEVIRRRMSDFVDPRALGELGIVAVGGKARFGPWLQLLESYADRSSGYRPIAYLVLGDGADAAADIARGYRDAQLTIPADMDREGRLLTAAFSAGDQKDAIAHTQEYNRLGESLDIGLALLPIDLEYAMLELASRETIRQISAAIGINAEDRDELATILGSKAHKKNVADVEKADWQRAEIARQLPWSELGSNVKSVLRRWVSPVLKDFGKELPRQLSSKRGAAQ